MWYLGQWLFAGQGGMTSFRASVGSTSMAKELLPLQYPDEILIEIVDFSSVLLMNW